MFGQRHSRSVAFVGVLACVLSLVACGSDSRDRNVEMIAGQTCQTLGQTKTVSKVVNVCGRSEDNLVWYAAVSSKPSGTKCTRPGGFRTSAGKTLICAIVKKNRMWIEVSPLPASVATSSPAPTVVAADAESTMTAAPSTGVTSPAAPSTTSSAQVTAKEEIPSKQIDPATAPAVAKASAPASRLKLVTKAVSSKNGAKVSPSPVVQIVDDAGNPKSVEGVEVRVVAAVARYAIRGGVATSDANGIISFPNLQLQGRAGKIEIAFVSNDLEGVTQSITHSVGDPVGITIIDRPTEVTAGEKWAATPTVQLVDVAGWNVAAADVKLHMAARVGKGPLADLGDATTDKNGEAVFDGASLSVTNTVAVTISAVDTSLVEESFEVAVVSAQANGLVLVSASPQLVQNDVEFDNVPKLQVVDRFGNPVKRAGVTVIASAYSFLNDKPVKASVEAVWTDSEGVATFDKFSLIGLAGPVTVTFSSASLASASLDVDLMPGPPTQLNVAVEPTGARSSRPLDVDPQIQVLDSSGNQVAITDGTVFVVADNAVVVTNGFADFNADGVAGFNQLKLIGKAGNVTLTFSFRNLTATRTISLKNGILGDIRVTRIPETVVAGEEFSADISLFDPQDNSVYDEGVVVMAKDPAGKLLKSASSGNGGFVTVEGLKLNKVGTTALTFEGFDARGSSLYRATVPVVVNPAAAETLVPVATSNINTLNAVPIPESVDVQVYDKFGNLATASGISVDASIVASPTGEFELTNSQAFTGADGVAHFTKLTLSGKIGTYTLAFSLTGKGKSVNYAGKVNLAAGPPAKIEIERAASGAVNRKLATVQPIIRLLDSYDNLSPTANVVVLASSKIGASSTLRAFIKTGSDGRAVFDNFIFEGNISGPVSVVYSVNGSTAKATQDLMVSPGVPARFTNLSTLYSQGSSFGIVGAVDVDNNTTSLDGYTVYIQGDVLNPFDATKLVWASRGGFSRTNGMVDTREVKFYGTNGSAASIEIGVREGSRSLFTYTEVFSFLTDPKAGDPGPAGGVIVLKLPSPIFPVDGITSGGQFLEMATYGWSLETGDSPLQVFDWSDGLTGVSTSTNVGSGPVNTKAIFDYQSRRNGYAATFVANARINGYDDWFLPSKNDVAGIVGSIGSRLTSPGWTTDFSYGVITSSLAGPGTAWYYFAKGGLTPTLMKSVGLMYPVRAFG